MFVRSTLSLHKFSVAILCASELKLFGFGSRADRMSQTHTGKCICRFGGIYAFCRFFIDRKGRYWVLILYRKTCHMPKGL